jgi:glucose-6-phosphate dehydrogenase assembly protein OpcA
MAGLETDRILEELSRHWAAIGKERGEGEGVVRACALTLVVLAEESDDAAAIGETLAQLMREHPNRAIVVRVRPGDKPFLGHNVFSQCWRPLGRGEQICCERIEITTSEASLADVAPVLVALRAPDLPTVLWYRSARIFDTPTLGASAFPGCKLIVDSDPSDPSRMLKRLAAAGPLVADLAWTRLTRWRATIAQLFESADCYELLPRLDHMRVLYSGERVPAQAFYMAAWILDSLGREIKYRFEAVEGHFGWRAWNSRPEREGVSLCGASKRQL